MRKVISGNLEVPGARIYHEVRGSGPALLVISTGNGDATPFDPMADALADRYTVITYDRRGFSRSIVDGPVDSELRMDADVDDALRLMSHLAEPPAFVFGTCSGAIVALALLERAPDRIVRLVAHEPPLVSVLADAAHWHEFHKMLYETYRKHGPDRARPMFRAQVGLIGETRPPKEAELPPDVLAELLERLKKNQVFWYEHELKTYPAWEPDLAMLKSVSGKLAITGGMISRESFSCRPATVLTELLGIELTVVPGGHISHVSQPFEFAEALDRVLKAGYLED
jgi:pimeloyl-ACP methyl ester carboxylesterase